MTPAPEAANRPSRKRATVEELLNSEPGKFDFFQAVEVLNRGEGRSTPPSNSLAVRFETPASTSFPANAIESISPAGDDLPPRMVVSFMGLTGPSGVLPRHYTDQLIELDRRLRDAAKRALHAWYDLFSNRFIGQLWRAWSRRRIDRGVVTGDADQPEPDSFTSALHSLAGVGMPTLRDRLQVRDATEEWTIDRISDQAIARHAGVLGRRQRPAAQIEATLSDYFQTPIRIEQFRGQWLTLEPGDRTSLGTRGQANRLGIDAVLGSRVWDLQSRIRIRVGPLSRDRFEQFLPECTKGAQRRRFHLLCQFVRLLVGPGIDFDIQLVLQQSSVTPLHAKSLGGQRLGWDAWLAAGPLRRDGDDPVFEPIESVTLAC